MLYLIRNGAMPTSAAFAALATGTAIKTHLQILPLVPMRIVEWGGSFDGAAAAVPGKVELIETANVFATVTAFVNADISKLTGPGDPDPDDFFTLGTEASGYNASAEDTVTASRYIDAPQYIAPTSQFWKQEPLGREGRLIVGNCYRIRAHFPVTVNMHCYLKIEVG